jgi:parvulin-like peptidyl-prolyl isomerase
MSFISGIFNTMSIKSFLLSLGVAVGVGAFVFTGFGKMGGINDHVAAEVGDQVITMSKLSQAVGNQGSSDDPERRKQDIQNALNQLIQDAILVEESYNMGWKPSPLEITHWMSRLEVFQNKDTKKFDKKAYEKFLKSGRMSELELYNEGQESIAKDRMIQALVSLSDHQPKAFLDEVAKRDKIEFQLEYILVEPTDAQIKAAAQVEAKKMAEDPAQTEELKKSYERNKTDFVRPAQANIRSILIGFEGAQRAQGEGAKRKKEDAKSLAQQILGEIKSGKSFSTLASTHNDDPTLKEKKGELGFVDATLIDPGTAEVALSLTKPGSHSEIIETAFGYRLIELIEKREAKEVTFEDAKVDLALRKVSTTAKENLLTQLSQQATEALKDPDPSKLNAFLSANHFQWKKMDKPFTLGSRFITELGMADGLAKEVFKLKKAGEVLPSLVTFTEKQALVKLVERKDQPVVDGESADSTRRIETMRFAQNFYTQAQRKLAEDYNKNRRIRRNESLLR